VCNLEINSVDVSCNPDGSVHWTAVVRNDGDCTVVASWRSTLQQHARGQGSYTSVAVEQGAQSFPPGNTTVEGDFCYDFPSSVNKMRVEFAIDNNNEDCRLKKKSEPENPCDPVEPCPPRFSDVAVEDTYYTPVMSLNTGGVVSGYADGTFRPYNNVTRAQVAKIVVLAFGFPLVAPQQQRFSDVPLNDSFSGYIETAYTHGLVSGYGDGTYRPTNNLTRGQLAKTVVLAAGLPLANPATPSFSDVAAGSTFYRYIETALARGLVSGYPDGTFRPGAHASRGQVCTVTMLAASAHRE
jgi:hypothetical protein